MCFRSVQCVVCICDGGLSACVCVMCMDHVCVDCVCSVCAPSVMYGMLCVVHLQR